MLTYRKEHKLSLTFLPVTFNEVMVKASQYVKQSNEGVLVELTAPELSPTLRWNTLLHSPNDLPKLPQHQLEILLDILMKAETKFSKFELMDILNGMEIELAILVLIKNNSTESLQTSHIDFMQKAFSPILDLKKEKVGRELFGEHYRKYIRKGKEQSRAFTLSSKPSYLWPGIEAYFRSKFESADEFHHFILLLERGKPSPYPYFKLEPLSLRNFILVFRILMKEESLVLSKSEAATWISRNFRFKNGQEYSSRTYRRIYDLLTDKSLDHLEEKIDISQDLK